MTSTDRPSISKRQLWAARILSGLPALFLLVDGGIILVQNRFLQSEIKKVPSYN